MLQSCRDECQAHNSFSLLIPRYSIEEPLFLIEKFYGIVKKHAAKLDQVNDFFEQKKWFLLKTGILKNA